MAIGGLATTGCGRVVFRPDQPAQTVTLGPEQQRLLAQQQQELQQRADQLDRDNQELETLLAQSRQQSQLLTEQITATQDQLRATAERLASSQSNNSELRERADALLAASQQSTSAWGVGFSPNSSRLEPVRLSGLPGVDVRQDGDVIRVAIGSDQLYYTGSPQLQPTGERLVEQVARRLMDAYPRHMIGLEGHTDGLPTGSAQYPTSHHLSVAQATAAYDALRRAGAQADQLFVIGHGSNHPRVSNATEAGRQRNRRLELVVYPERTRRR